MNAIPSYLENETIDKSDLLNSRESGDFKYATYHTKLNSTQSLEERFEAITQVEMISFLSDSFAIFNTFEKINLSQLDRFFNLLNTCFKKNFPQQLALNQIFTPDKNDEDHFEKFLRKKFPRIENNKIKKYSTIAYPFIAISKILKLKLTQEDFKEDVAIVINWWPKEELQWRIKESSNFINNMSYDPKIIVTWWETPLVEWTKYNTEADMIEDLLKKAWVKKNIAKENEAKNTWENAKLVSGMIEWKDWVNIFTTGYWAVRVALTAQKQMPFTWDKKVHWTDFSYRWVDYWSDYWWFFQESWWKALAYSLNRLIKYRARTDPFL